LHVGIGNRYGLVGFDHIRDGAREDHCVGSRGDDDVFFTREQLSDVGAQGHRVNPDRDVDDGGIVGFVPDDQVGGTHRFSKHVEFAWIEQNHISNPSITH
jgi:hydrogenase maturation factor HypE